MSLDMIQKDERGIAKSHQWLWPQQGSVLKQQPCKLKDVAIVYKSESLRA